MRLDADNRSKKAPGSDALRLFGFLLACSALSCMVPVSARAQSDAAMRAKLEQMENDIQTLNRAVYKGETPPPAPVAPNVDAAGSAAAASELRISQLETEFRTMTGTLEEIQHQLQTMQQGIDQANAKLDARLTALEQKQAPTPAAPVPAASPVSGSDSGATMPPQPAPVGSLTQPDLATPPPTTDRFTGGTASHPPSVRIDPTTGLTPPKPQTLGTLSPSDTAKAASDTSAPASPDQAYEEAYTLFKLQKYDQAQAAFEDFLKKYPKYPLAANAQFWIGESFFARNQFDKAAKAFALAYQNYPQGPKGADSLLKLGLSLNALGKKNEACLTWAQLKRQYPTAGPTLTRANNESQKTACKG